MKRHRQENVIMQTLTRIFDKVADLCGTISIFFAVLMTLIVVGNVISRGVFNTPIVGSYEIVELSKGITVFFAFSYAQKRKTYIHVVMVVRKLPRVLAHICFAIGALITSGVGALVSIGAFQYGVGLKASHSVTGVLLIPYEPFAYIEGVAWSIFTLILLFDCIKAFLAIGNSNYAKEIESNWV
jgi:TRAP-type C4-dicarboxylate transport system permease small subunit